MWSSALLASLHKQMYACMLLVPFALEDGGRPAEEALAFVRMLGAVRTEAEDGCLDWGGTAMLWQQCSTLLQLGNAELVLSANGR